MDNYYKKAIYSKLPQQLVQLSHEQFSTAWMAATIKRAKAALSNLSLLPSLSIKSRLIIEQVHFFSA